MKIGDKLICKKRFDKSENFFCVFAKDDSNFEIDQTYLVNQIHISNTGGGTTISVSCGFFITLPSNNTREENTFFSLEDNTHRKPSKSTMPYLYDFFYTPKEIRKLKLRKMQRDQKFEKLGWI